MSDDDADSVSSSSALGTDYQNHPRVYHVLRDFCDVPTLEYQSSQPIALPRHGDMKPIVILATIYHVYLFKKKGLKLYTRWPARHLTTARKGSSVYFSLGIDAETVASNHQQQLRGSSKGSKQRRRKSDSSDEDDGDTDDDENDLDYNQEDNTFTSCRVVCEREVSAKLLISEVNQVIYRAKAIAEKHKREEEGRTKRQPRISFKDDLENDDGEEDRESTKSDDGALDGDADELQRAVIKITAEAVSKAKSSASSAVDVQHSSTRMLQSAPGRYIAVGSLVDGEFADYTALKNAYLRNEEGSLLEDLRSFIADQELQVEGMCRMYYPAFLHAAEQCARITSHDAETVRDELSGAMRLMRDAATDMKHAASILLLSRGVMHHMTATQSFVEQLKRVAEALETTEVHVGKEQLLGAAISLEALTSAAGSVAEFALGGYVLHNCIPRLKRRIILSAQAQLNRWLSRMRASAEDVGRDTILQRGHERVVAGRMVRRAVVSDDRNGSWCTVSSFHASTATWSDEHNISVGTSPSPAGSREKETAAATAAAAAASKRLNDTLSSIVGGASVQRVFNALGLQETFRKAYADARAKQLFTDILDPAHVTKPPPSENSVSALDLLSTFCYRALGSLILEDLAIHATRPAAVRSDADMIALWDGVCAQVALLVQSLEASFMGASEESTMSAVSSVLELLSVMSTCVKRLVTSTYLNPLGLARVSERLSNHLHSLWVQNCCADAAVTISVDPLAPIPVRNATEFLNYASMFHLHRCGAQELPIPATYKASMNLPYAIFVPAIADRVLKLIANCYDAHHSSEVNNFDDMMLEYLQVVFRTAHSVVQGRVQSVAPGGGIQLAVLISSCSAMCVVASIAEMEFTVRCGYGEEGERGRQVLGSPVLLDPAAALFRQLTNHAIEKLSNDLQQDATSALLPAARYSYWKSKYLAKRERSIPPPSQQEPCALAALSDLIKKRVSPLKELLQPPVFRSIVSFLWMFTLNTMQQSIEQAINVYHVDQDTAMMKNCVTEYRLEVREWVPRIRAQMDVLEATSSAASNQSVQSRIPIDFDRIADEFEKRIEARDVEIAEEKAKNLLLANLDAARQAGAAVVTGMAHGVADVGRATGKSIWKIGQTVKNGINSAGSATTPRASGETAILPTK